MSLAFAILWAQATDADPKLNGTSRSPPKLSAYGTALP